MNTRPSDPPPEVLVEIPFPRHLHGKIMKRVFFAGYGRYFYLTAGVLFLNIVMLGVNLYYAMKDMKLIALSVDSFSARNLYEILPLGSIISTALIAGLCAYLALVCIKASRGTWKNESSLIN